MTGGVASFGSVNVDLVASVQRLPRAGETIAASAFRTVLGGKGANQAVAAARLLSPGLPAARLIGLTGGDAFGAFSRERLASFGVDLSGLGETGTDTGLALIHIDSRGENAITVAAGANGRVDADTFERAVSAGGLPAILLLQGEIPLEACLHAAGRVRAEGGLVLFDPAPPLPGPQLDAMLAAADIVLPNAHEAALLTGVAVTEAESARDAAHALLGRGARAALVKIGPAGAWLAGGLGGDSHDGIIPAPVVRAIDTVAAGDCFAGALAAALRSGHNLAASALFAARAAAISVTRRGAADAMPGLGDLENHR